MVSLRITGYHLGLVDGADRLQLSEVPGIHSCHSLNIVNCPIASGLIVFFFL
jgi:hypothetical protein